MLPGGRALITQRLPVAYPEVTNYLPSEYTLVNRRVAAGYGKPVAVYR